ncbi:MAG: hypothetical protein HDR19_01910 [Lachnospiraceae bacterium]|nr:hypothetical protein [Lachnospiraceae bacterium]
MISNEFNLEEINLIHSCRATERQMLIKELNSFMDSKDPAMREIIHNTISKLNDITPSQMAEIINYPAENANSLKGSNT